MKNPFKSPANEERRKVLNTLIHNLIIHPNSWHARWYRHWQSLGGEAPAYKENLCHYVRVLLIWAPLRWFFKDRIMPYVPPWAAALASNFLAFVGVAFYLWPSISLEVLWKAGAGLGSLITAIALVVGVVYLYDRDPKTSLKIAKWTTLPFWVIPYLLFLGGRWIWKTFEDEFRSFSNFLERRVFFGTQPIAVLFTLLGAGLIALSFYKNPIRAAIVFGSILFAGCLIVGAVILVERHRARQPVPMASLRPRTPIGRAYEGVADTVKLGATYVSTKKKGSRICPFLSFEK